MWGRIYPHVVFLIFANFIFKASCKGNGSLTFLIDDTGSMSDDIRQVRRSVNRISNIVFNEKSSVIGNMVLVTFNDPDAKVRTVTKNRRTFKRTLEAVYAHNIVNRDCWEPSMNGLLLALDTSNRDSFIYVFTDAPAKDYRDSRYVEEMCQKKQSQIVFVLTGRCSDIYEDKAFDVYFDIAHACSGLAFDVTKSDVEQVLRTIEETIRGNKTVITTAIVPPDVKKDIPFVIDDQTDYAIVSVSGKNVYLDIKGPSASLERLMWNSNGKVVKLSDIVPGTYVVTVMGNTRTSVVIVGRTDFFFTHGFSTQTPKSLDDTSLQPIADANVHLSISVTDEHHSVKIVSAQILDMDEKPIKSPLPLTEVSKDFYVTGSLVAPSQRFKLAVNGIVKATGKPIQRIVKIPITPAKPPKKLPKNTKPTAKITEGKTIKIEYNSTMKLTCKVVAFPEPKIQWINMEGGLMPSQMSLIEYPYDYISYMSITNASKEDKYKCYAVNDYGRDEKTINVFVNEAFTVKAAPPGLTILSYGEEGTITCDITSRLPMEIHWSYANEISGQTREIVTSDKYEIYASGTKLKIKKMDMDLVGRYVCKASLINKKDVKKVLITRVKVDGLIAPKIQGVTDVKVTKGETAVLECKVSGVPPPKITWLFGGKSDSKFTPIAGSESVLRITNVETKHDGNYKCVVENDLAKDEHVTKLFVQDIPKIITNSALVYHANEGEALLRIPCVTTGAPTPVIIWKLSGRNITPGAKYSIEDGALIIRDPKVSDTNSYTCEATNDVGSVSATFKTFIRQAPQVSGVATKKVRIGSPASIECTIDKGEPKPTITWQFMEKSGSKYVTVAGSNNVLHISKVEIKDAGRYKCVAQNSVGSNDHITTLEVQEAPQVSGVAIKKVRIGSPASIECTIDKGEPKPTITWQFMEKSGSKYVTVAGSNNVLHILKVENKDAGRYKCIAHNSVGSNEHITTLQVQDLPKISPNHVSTIYQSTEGDAFLKIPCEVAGLPKPSITWKLNGRVISPNAKYSIEDGLLIIRDPKVSDTNSYICEAKNEVGSVSATFKTYIRQAPQVSGVATKKVRIGSPASIECTVDKGVPKPTITWQFMEKSDSNFVIVPGTNNVLHILKAEKKDAGRYKCVAHNNVGNHEHVTTLEVQDLPKIVSNNVSTIYQSTEGDAFLKIPCKVAGLPKPSITWKLNGRVISPNAKYSIEDGLLIIRDPKVSDTNSYTCEVKNEVGSDSATFKTYIRQAPQVSGVATKKVRIGSPASIECTIDKGEPKPTITWQFMDKSVSKYVTVPGSNNVLHILKVENKDAGRYKCVAHNSVGNHEHVTTLEVQDLPKISSDVSTIYQKTEGDALLRIPCDVTGLPKPTITWKLSSHVINPNAKYSIEDGTLIIRDLKVSDTNSYTCEAKNEVGSVSATFRTYIRQLPKLSGAAIKNVKMSTPATIECIIVKGVPKPNITWQFMDKSTSKYVAISGSESTLRIPKVQTRHSGLYKCVAQNEVGRDEHVTTLNVEFSPAITSNSSTVEGIEGDLALRIPCNVTGNPKPVITWKLKGATITPDAKYSIEDGALVISKPTEKDSSLYTCEAKNSISTVSATVKTIVEKLPKNFGTEHFVYLLEGETRKIKCEAYNSKSQSVQWFATKAISSLTTTSASLGSSTTEAPSKATLKTPRTIITEKTDNKEPEMPIVNAAHLFHDGNYTCRVSDKHGNTQTHTYVVDVGIAPKFVNKLYPLNNWRGDISDIKQNCKTNRYAKPIPVVQWTLNGKVVTDLNSFGIGSYVCNVSNVHGSVHRSFDVKTSECLISRNLANAQYMPLILNDGGYWNTLENTDHYTIISEEEKIVLSCPSQKGTKNAFKKFPEINTLDAYCVHGDSFMVEATVHKLSDLQCTDTIQPSVIRKNKKCSTENSELISVGYNVPHFLEAYQVCFDHEKEMPAYTRVLMSDGNNNGLSSTFNWYKYPGIGHEKAERGFTCTDTLTSCCYSKSQLVNAIDFNDGSAKKSTFIDPLNAIPVWLPCDNSKTSWENVNNMVRSRLAGYTDILAWSGTHQLEVKNGAIIPRYLWKVARLDDDAVVAIVYINSPSPTAEDVKCEETDICEKHKEWLDTDENTYCCSLPDFLKSFDIHSTDIGETMSAFLDKIAAV